MKIGISLPPDYLAGTSGERCTEFFGRPAALLDRLRRAGVEAVELRAIGPESPVSTALDAARRVLDAGFALTVHGVLPATTRPAGPGPALEAVCGAVARGRTPALITVHSHRSDARSLEDLTLDTVRAVRGMLEALAGVGTGPVRIAVESMRQVGTNDPGATYAALLDLHDRIGHPDTGFCWDIGHSYVNVLHGLCELPPPQAFVERVIHTHIHALGPHNRTHFPLTIDSLPWRDFLEVLRRCGYDGLLNLELSPERFHDTHPADNALLESVRMLREYLFEH